MSAAPRRILVAREADAAQLNAQCKNAQHILRRWRSPDWRAGIFGFAQPDEGIAGNPNVDIIRLPSHGLWPFVLAAAYSRGFDGIFYPGLHDWADWAGLKIRAAMGRRVPVISTIESLVCAAGDAETEERLSALAGHRVYCGTMPAGALRRLDEILAMADHIIAISPFLARMGRALYGDKVSTLPLGVDLDLFGGRAFGRRKRPRIVGAGTVYPRKRPEVFVTLAEKFPDADFVWYGEGDLRKGLSDERARRELANLDFPGALPPERLAEEMSKSDILLLPSFAEGAPKVTQEAAAAGLAQIVFGFYEAPTVIDGHNGFVVWSDAELSDRLSQLLRDPDLVERMGRAGQAMAQGWSWREVAPQWERRIIDACAAGIR